MEKEDSIYRLFGDLSAFVKDRRIPLTEGQEGRAETRAQELKTDESNNQSNLDERIAFFEAMRDIQRIEQDKQRIGHIRSEQKAAIEEHDEEKKLTEALDEQCRLNVVNLPEYMEGCVEGINPVTMEKLRSGDYSVQKVLDLHGLRADEAYEIFQSFIKDAIREKSRCVKVIHGRGLKSKHEPVLKGRLKGWIMKAMHRKWVIAFASANMRDGGPGATNILLRQQPKKQRIKIMG